MTRELRQIIRQAIRAAQEALAARNDARAFAHLAVAADKLAEAEELANQVAEADY